MNPNQTTWSATPVKDPCHWFMVLAVAKGDNRTVCTMANGTGIASTQDREEANRTAIHYKTINPEVQYFVMETVGEALPVEPVVKYEVR